MNGQSRPTVWQISICMVIAMLGCWSCAGTPGPSNVDERTEIASLGAKLLHVAVNQGVERGFEVLPDCPHGNLLEAYIGFPLEEGYSVIVVGSSPRTKISLMNENLIFWILDRSNLESQAAELVRGRHRPVVVLDFEIDSYSPEQSAWYVSTRVALRKEEGVHGRLQWCTYFFGFLLCTGPDGRLRLALNSVSTP